MKIIDKTEWFKNELLESKKKYPFFSWYYPKWLAITEWYYRIRNNTEC